MVIEYLAVILQYVEYSMEKIAGNKSLEVYFCGRRLRTVVIVVAYVYKVAMLSHSHGDARAGSDVNCSTLPRYYRNIFSMNVVERG